MICKHGDFKNGYIFTTTSTDRDFQNILRENQPVRCIICNENTIKNFRQSPDVHPHITINKKLADGVFFLNGVY